MKLVSYTKGETRRLGVLDSNGGRVSPLESVDGRPLGPADVCGVLEGTMRPAGPNGIAVRPAEGPNLSLAEVQLQAPIAEPPRNVFCVGKNYAEHSLEFDRSGYDATSSAGASGDDPEHPIVFTKARNAIIGPDAPVDPHQSLTRSLDYEAELAVIIGRRGRSISREDAWNYVWGMTLTNDITARDLQRKHKQWFIGKSLDTFLPMGPWAVSMDELARDSIVLECRVNGELRQQANIKDMIFDIPEIIATLSAGMTLEPGDVIATGTPAGVGIGFEPARFLVPGDEVEVSATGLGTLKNTIGHPRLIDHDDSTADVAHAGA